MGRCCLTVSGLRMFRGEATFLPTRRDVALSLFVIIVVTVSLAYVAWHGSSALFERARLPEMIRVVVLAAFVLSAYEILNRFPLLANRFQ
jgi:hypothetical protein